MLSNSSPLNAPICLFFRTLAAPNINYEILFSMNWTFINFSPLCWAFHQIEDRTWSKKRVLSSLPKSNPLIIRDQVNFEQRNLSVNRKLVFALAILKTKLRSLWIFVTTYNSILILINWHFNICFLIAISLHNECSV